MSPPGPGRGLHLGVDDIHAARAELVGRGVEVAEVGDLSAPGKPTVPSYDRLVRRVAVAVSGSSGHGCFG